MLSLAFVASSFRVTEENLIFETVQSGPPSFFLIFLLLLNELTFIFLFEAFVYKDLIFHSIVDQTTKKAGNINLIY